MPSLDLILRTTLLVSSINHSFIDSNCRLGVIGNLSSSAVAAITRSQPPDGADSSGKILCSVCMESYKHQLARLVTEEIKKSPSKVEDNKALPKWLQLAKLSNGGGTKPSTSLLQVSFCLQIHIP